MLRYLRLEKVEKYSHDKVRICAKGRSLAYTVDEVSELLEVPRPTLYRYLREYSIPHTRRAGKISIPEDSLERIQRARELHETGLGTESVRARLMGNSEIEVGEVAERLNQLSEILEELREDRKSSRELTPSSQTMQVILARQSLLMSAVFNMTGMLEELLAASGHPRRTSLEDLKDAYERTTPLNGNGQSTSSMTHQEHLEPAPAPELPKTSEAVEIHTNHRRRFGAAARRRKQAALAIGLLCVLGVVLAWPFLAGLLG
jgi:excisionase family DNA binding protein